MTICLTQNQLYNIRKAVRDGCKAFERQEPVSLSDWADENFYLSSESSYVAGRWKTLPFQKAIMNAMGHDQIKVVNWIKSARVGYSQMIRAAVGYFTEHKARNQLLYQPTDGAAEDFMKAHIDTMVRDVPCMKPLCPWLGKKHRDNTLKSKTFSNGKKLWVLGGESPKNYRDKSVDVVYYDEFAAFKPNIGNEGSAVKLGDKRTEGSVFPKSIRGSTPKILGECQISKTAEQSEYFFRMHIPCPHCEHKQPLEFGDKESKNGFKWIDNDPSTTRYACISCGALGTQQEWYAKQQYGIYKDGDVWTRDGLTYYKGRRKIPPPEEISFHVWTAYSPFTTWEIIVKGFLQSAKNPNDLQTFVNTTLGECWDNTEGEKLDYNSLYMRREFYKSELPIDNAVITASVDVQDDRLEYSFEAWLEGEENYTLSYERIYGDLSRSEIWQVLARKLNQTFQSPSGAIQGAEVVFIDSGGHYTDEVYEFSRRNGLLKFIPIKGSSKAGSPIVDFPRKRNRKGVYLTMIGTDTAKEITANRLLIQEVGAGFIHFPHTDQFDVDYFKHLTNEKRKSKVVNGRRVIVWDAEGKRNEPWDLKNYNLAAIRFLIQHRGKTLGKPQRKTSAKKSKKKAKANKSMIDLG